MGESKGNTYVELFVKGGFPLVLVGGGLAIAIRALPTDSELDLIPFFTGIAVVLLGLLWAIVAMWGKALLAVYRKWNNRRFRRMKPAGATFTASHIDPVAWHEAVKLPEGAHKARGHIGARYKNGVAVERKQDSLMSFLVDIANLSRGDHLACVLGGRSIVNLKCRAGDNNDCLEAFALVFEYYPDRVQPGDDPWEVRLDMGSEMPPGNRKGVRDRLAERLDDLPGVEHEGNFG